MKFALVTIPIVETELTLNNPVISTFSDAPSSKLVQPTSPGIPTQIASGKNETSYITAGLICPYTISPEVPISRPTATQTPINTRTRSGMILHPLPHLKDYETSFKRQNRIFMRCKERRYI